jgi:DNA-binding GntR family transcriptional regulator
MSNGTRTTATRRGSIRKTVRGGAGKDGTPRYASVAGALIAAIAKGRYPVGSTLPTEHALCEAFGVSRFTVREALRQLSEAGLVSRKPRAGTMVIAARRRVPYAQTLGSLDDLLQYAGDTELRLVYTGTVQADPALARDIPLAAGETWLFAIGVRFRRDDELPVCLTRVYINPGFRGLARRLKDRTDTIYKLIERHHGVAVARVEQRIFAVALSRDDALHLKAKAGSAALRTVRLYYDAAGRLIEASDSIHPGDRFSYAMTIRKSSQAR